MNELFENMQKKGQENYEVAVKSIEVASKGFQEVSKEVADYSKKAAEETAAHFQSVTAANSVEKAVEAQTAFAKTSFEAFVAEATKLGEMYTAVAKEAYAPIEASFAAK